MNHPFSVVYAIRNSLRFQTKKEGRRTKMFLQPSFFVLICVSIPRSAPNCKRKVKKMCLNCERGVKALLWKLNICAG